MHDYQIDNLVASAFSLLVLGWLTALAARLLQRAAERRHELRLRLLERCSTAELVDLLGTAEGREWLGRFLSGGAGAETLDESGLERAVVLIVVGLACGAAGALLHFQGARALALAGSLAVAWGLALLAARWWLARRHGPG